MVLNRARSEASGSPADARQLRWLFRLVLVLTTVMILGIVTITALLVIRLTRDAPPPALPANLVLPEGTRAEAVTAGRGWYAVVTADHRILVFGSDGALRQTIRIGE